MKYCLLGKTGIEISAVILGTWQAGKSMWAGIEDSQTLRAIQAAVDAGVTTIDTAEAYGHRGIEESKNKSFSANWRKK